MNHLTRILLILLIVVWSMTCFFVGRATSAMILRPDGGIQRPEQDWDNRTFSKSPNLSVNLYYGGCPDTVYLADRTPGDGKMWSCVPRAHPVIYLYPDPNRVGRRWVFHHELFHVAMRRGRYVGPMIASEEVMADLYANCSMGYWAGTTHGASISTYARACGLYRRYMR